MKQNFLKKVRPSYSKKNLKHQNVICLIAKKNTIYNIIRIIKSGWDVTGIVDQVLMVRT